MDPGLKLCSASLGRATEVSLVVLWTAHQPFTNDIQHFRVSSGVQWMNLFIRYEVTGFFDAFESLQVVDNEMHLLPFIKNAVHASAFGRVRS